MSLVRSHDEHILILAEMPKKSCIGSRTMQPNPRMEEGVQDGRGTLGFANPRMSPT